uniref:AAA+ ATPase domain-containing protein n=1 Tax=Oryza punctata TaxID=4537 RepID=A0A0E0MHA7_ORYPU
MASLAVLEFALWKLERLLQQSEDPRTASIREKVRPMYDALASFKAELEWLEGMEGPHAQGTSANKWRNDVVDFAYGVEDLADIANFMVQDAIKVTPELHDMAKSMTNRLDQSIPRLSRWKPSVPAVKAEFLGASAWRKLVRFLSDGEEQLKAIAIVGFAGSGKTSLAMELYRQIEEGEFECQAIALVSQRPDMKKLLNHLLSQLHPIEPLQSQTPDLGQLIDNVREYLRDKRYLVVLDDIWQISPGIENLLPKNNCGSRIIMTTRNKRLANLGFEKWLADPGCGIMYDMESLSVAENMENFSVAENMEFRETVHRDSNRDVQKLERDRQRFNPSYADLNPFLKLHLMLMCMFPPNYHFKRDLLLRIWRAEGFVMSRPSGEKTANEILDELIDRNVILPVRHNDISQVEAWKVHDRMLECFLYPSAGEENFLVVSNMDVSTRSERVRRLALHSRNRELDNLITELDFGYISSLSVFKNACKVPLEKLGYLRVLDIQCRNKLKDDDLRHICRMVLLRYLSLRSTGVRKIPAEISNLKFLETLDLRDNPVQQLPEQVGQLHRLSDLLVGNQEHQTNSCRVKICLGHRYFSSLQTLETIHLNDAWLILKYVRHLKEVAIMCPSQQSSYSQDKLCSSLKECHELQSLTLYSGLGCSMEFLHSLVKPPHDLRSLMVNGGFVSLPRWIARLKNLVLLQIRVCRLSPEDLKVLGELPRLQRLTLGLDFLMEQEIDINGFPDLKRFSVDCRVPWLAFQQGAMPKLAELELKFREAPEGQQSIPSGISYLLSLKQINIFYSSWCRCSPRVNVTVQAIMSAIREHVRPVKLIINGSFYSVQ